MPVYIKIKKSTLLIILFLIVFLLVGFILGFLVSKKRTGQSSGDKMLIQVPEETGQKSVTSPKPKSTPRTTPKPSPQKPSLPSEILGGWTVYHDCPNATIHFYTQGKVKVFYCDGNYQALIDEMGSYTYDGSKTIKVFYSEGDFATLEIIKEGGTTYLQVEGSSARYWKFE